VFGGFSLKIENSILLVLKAYIFCTSDLRSLLQSNIFT